MNKKVLCPYCESEMELEHFGTDEDEYFVYVCPDCAAQSPISYSAESALATALARPLQKPLTLEEFKKNGFAFIELNEEYYSDYVFPAHYIAFGWSHYSIILTKCNALLEGLFGIEDDDENQAWIDNDDYCKAWRCWATKPTDEEREAAKWG